MNLLVLAGLICLVVGLVKAIGWLLAGLVVIGLAVLIELA